ncbi:MAG: type II toxin-antitoxin system RelE/ParE family toxin [SAR202 cluster bacterium]|nr:type II toxin-antitoxin system RelE/ParE family toxin [SAR202 cluster bacterium]
MSYEIEFTPAAERNLRRIPRQSLGRIERAIQALAQEPRPSQVRKISGYDKSWRIRVGQFRVVYNIYDDKLLIVVVRIARRQENTYRF